MKVLSQVSLPGFPAPGTLIGGPLLQNPPLIRVSGTFTRSLYQFTRQSTNTEVLYRAGQAFEKELGRLDGLMDVTSDLQIKSPQTTVEMDRNRAASLGVTPEQIENALYDAYGPRWISTIYAPNNQYRVLISGDRSCFHSWIFRVSGSKCEM